MSCSGYQLQTIFSQRDVVIRDLGVGEFVIKRNAREVIKFNLLTGRASIIMGRNYYQPGYQAMMHRFFQLLEINRRYSIHCTYSDEGQYRSDRAILWLKDSIKNQSTSAVAGGEIRFQIPTKNCIKAIKKMGRLHLIQIWIDELEARAGSPS